jgi:hypothetical protein
LEEAKKELRELKSYKKKSLKKNSKKNDKKFKFNQNTVNNIIKSDHHLHFIPIFNNKIE